MAIGWLTVLKSVPWVDVVTKAPAIADGARKLWNTVSKKQAPTSVAQGRQHAGPDDAVTLEDLEDRVAILNSAFVDLRGEMVTSSRLINELAEQNTQLIARMDAMRARLRWLAVASTLLGLAVLGLFLFR